MISATIQGKDKSNNRGHTTAQNGELITGEAQRQCVNAILQDCKEVSANREKYCKLENGKFFCALYHPECDDIGRKRIALIVLDKDIPSEIIQKTLKVMGLEYERFLELKQKFEARENIGVSKNALLVIGVVALVAFGVYLAIKK